MSTQTKHTPGPWDIHTSFDSLEIHQLSDSDGLCTIADLPVDSGLSKVEREANARLISSAPELLEALEYAKKRIVLLQQYTEGKVDTSDIGKLNSAINKAKGL